MSTIYLIRHGQAGSRENYDQLSEMGQRQARLLGEHWATRAMGFDAVYAGGMVRQQLTARIAIGAMTRMAAATEGIETDARWNEFSLRSVYEWMAPRLAATDARFARDFEEMQREIQADPHSVRGAAGRCDRAVIEAWMADRHPTTEIESWDSFRARVLRGFDDLLARHFQTETQTQIAIFTSVTPIAVCLGRALGLENEKILRLMAVIYNSSVTVMKIRFGEPLLFHFNATPHLHDDALLSFR
ncbi:MAG: histidine phosphatase family protein [Blastocatellia bacterium]|nr:histidine phosphatase family protein [Blastocatellia bacterium]